ncbi:MAG: DUF4258 domain-containing protein [Veillonellales bacterium]
MNLLERHENRSIARIRQLCQENTLRWTQHALLRLFQRSISTDDVAHALSSGEIIESYPEAHPYPSYLVLGVSIAKTQLHVVCGLSDIELWIITAYYPNPNEWEADYKTRRKNL